MKRNALFRITLWSTVLLLLLAILFVLFFAPRAERRLRDETPAATEVLIPMVTSPVDTASCNAIAVHNANIRSAPHEEAEVVALAPQGTTLEITRQESINGSTWGYIVSPVSGWISMDYVELLEPVAEETEVAAEPTEPYNAVVSADALNVRTMPSKKAPTAGKVEKGDQLLITKQELVDGTSWGYIPAPVNGWVMMEYVELLEPTDVEITTMETTAGPEAESEGYGVAVDAASIRDMEIEWAAGSIVIKPMDITEIRISEEGASQSSDPMVWKVKDGKLVIQYSRNTDHDFGISLLQGKDVKNLTIQVPRDWSCNSLEIDAASASLEVRDLTIREMEFDGASGTCIFNNCTVENLDLDTASGDVLFKGSLTQMECDAASANIILELSSIPKSLDLDTASGNLDLTLPENAGFTVTMDTMSGEFTSDFTTTQRNGGYVAGNGRCRIDVDAMSGNVIIRKGQ